MRLFAPLYLSSECINNCQYCGFSRDNPILRVTLSTDEVEAEGEIPGSPGIPQYSAGLRRTSEVRLERLSADCCPQTGFICAIRLD